MTTTPDLDALLEQEARPDRNREIILDAALVEASKVGIERVTVEDVWKRSGLGRMTVYRRFPKRDDMLMALRERESSRFLMAVNAGMKRAEDRREAVIEGFVAAMLFSRTHPIMGRVPDSDPGAFVAGMAAFDGALLTLSSTFIARHMHGYREGEPTQAEMRAGELLARLFMTYVCIPPKDPDPEDEDALRAFGRAMILPIIERATS